MSDFSWPKPVELPARPRRFVWHWTAGAHKASMTDLSRYHVLVEHHEGDPEDPSDDRVVYRAGVPLARNCQQIGNLPPYHRDADRGYAAHVKGMNSFSGGIALCGMRGADDFRPSGDVSPGPSPITLEQVRAMLSLSVQAARIYGLEVTEDTFMTHREVEAIHGIDQLPPGDRIWKWNVEWIPGFRLELTEAGPFLREQVRRWMAGRDIDDRLYAPPSGSASADALFGQDG